MPFYGTATEVRCSKDTAAHYHLYRVFDFAGDARLYVLAGSLRDTCQLEPSAYIAAVGAGPDE